MKLYYNSASAPCRATLLTLRALELDVELEPINLATDEHLTTKFLKINLFHTVPTLIDGDFTLCDSHAINSYLTDKYGNSHESLYPKDVQKRAVVNQRLHFDSHMLSARLAAITVSILRDGIKTIPKDKSDGLVQALTILETVLENNKYVCGDSMTIADFSMVATVSTANAVLPLATNRFPKIFEWMERMESLSYYEEANKSGLLEFTALIKSKIVIRQR